MQILLLLICLLFNPIAHASPTPYQVVGLADVITAAKTKTKLKILVPLQIANLPAKACAYLDAAIAERYRITIDRDCDCHGAHYCNIASFSAEVGANPVIHHNMQNQEATEAIKLANGNKAYYTQGYALASYFPASISWRCANTLYTISWDKPKAQLMALANRAIGRHHCQQ